MEPENSKQNDDQAQRDAASRVVRDQLEAIYGNHPKVVHPTGDSHQQQQHAHQHQQPQQHAQQQHTAAPAEDTENHWKRYHAEWQEYYRRYYENYYVGHLHQAIHEQEESAKSPEEKRDDELVSLRQKIIDNARDKAKKARKSRHFIPFASALVVVLVVVFLQYNQIIIGTVQAYVSPGAIDPQNIVVDPTADVNVTPDPKLIIPKINVDVPVIYGVPLDYSSQMAAMQKGVAHFAIPGADSVPGQVGNTVFSGHSSNDLFDPGDYKFIFAQLDKIGQGDTIYVNYNSIRYTYTVTKKQIVKPSDVQSLIGYTDKPYLTLITCTPLGTSLNRLLVFAEQVAPDPSKAVAASAPKNGANATMPGNAPTVLEKLFGAH